MNLQTRKAALLATIVLASGVSPVRAFAADGQPDPGSARGGDEQTTGNASPAEEEIIVTARRKEETLQDVPQTVNAVTSDDLADYNIFRAGDIDEVVSGLQVVGDNISMRGISFVTISNTTTPTVATYINDVPVPAVLFNTATFDLGQIEVLRGPQGTLRGIASPSGAITVTTRRPDLSNVEGYAMGTVGTRSNYNLQGGVGVPIISDKLAVRIAGVIDKTDGNGIRSINNSDKPRSRTEAVRASLRFEPTSNLTANLMYQHLTVDGRSFGSAVFGSGAPGGVNPNAPAGYNGPVLTMEDKVAVTESPTISKLKTNMVIGQLDWRVAGQRVTYVGSWEKIHTLVPFAAADTGNSIPGYEAPGPRQDAPKKIKTHELRLSSDQRIAGIFDYVAGAFLLSDKTPVFATSGIAAFLPGAFGSPLSVPAPVPPNSRYVIDTFVFLPREYEETSFFGNLTAHIGDNLEISAGARHIHSEALRDVTIETQPAFIAQALPAQFCTLAGGQFGATYPGICDVPVPSRRTVLASNNLVKNNSWIYDAAISYDVTKDLMIYGHMGSSWREGGFTIGINNATNDPVLNDAIFMRPEKSTSYEAGLKWSFLNRRGRVNVAYYHQKFTDFIFTVPGCIRYLSYTSPTGSPSVQAVCNFGANVPAKIDGIDVDAAFEITRHWNVSGNFSWANSRISNALLPCNDGNFDGVPDGILPNAQSFLDAGVLVARCTLSTGASSAPKWNARVQSEYRAPISGQFEGFIRGNFGYQPKNPNASQTFVVPSYALLDLFLGVRDPNGAWELTAYGKNILKTKKVIALDAAQINPPAGLRSVFGDTGYRTFSWTPRREFGVTARYSF